MSQPAELRLFISSTFRDLQEEREHLVKKIFPEIRALCRERGITFTEIDLRWGLTDEEGALGRIIRTCLEEIDRCRPYFIGIVGNRYGYVPPLHEYYKDSELLRHWPWLEDAAMEGASITDLEFRHGALNDPTSASRVRFYARRVRPSLRVDFPSDEQETQSTGLKDRVRAAGFTIDEYRDPASLGEKIYDDLIEIIRQDFSESQPRTPLEEDRIRHEAFAASRRRAYIPNVAYLEELDRWLEEAPSPLVVFGESGSGKSSLLSFWCERLRQRRPDLYVVEHYVGVGANDSDHIGLIRHVMLEIADRFLRNEEVPTTPAEIEQGLGLWLGFASHALRQQGKRMVLVLDGLNQLQRQELQLLWLPDATPPEIRLIVSSTSDSAIASLQERGWRAIRICPLEEAEREAVIVRFLSEYHKALPTDLTRVLARSQKCSHPLFLRTLLEELRIYGHHLRIAEHAQALLQSSGTGDLFQRVLERMEDDYSLRTVRDVMSLLWCSKGGLSEDELEEITATSRLRLSTLLLGLDYHLIRRDGLLTFFHDYLRQATEERYLYRDEVAYEQYRLLTTYFERREISLRATRELLHALEGARDYSGLKRVLTNIDRFEELWPADRYEVQRLWATSDISETGKAYDTAIALWREHGNPTAERQVLVLGYLTELYDVIGAWSEAERCHREQVRLVRQTEDRVGEARALASLSSLVRRLGRPREAEQLAREAERIGREVGDLRSVASATGNRGIIHLNRGEYSEALACYTDQENIALELGDYREVAGAVGSRGLVHADRGEYTDALNCYVRKEEIARRSGDLRGVAHAVGNRGLVHMKRAEYVEADGCYAEQEQLARELGSREDIAIAVGNRGIVNYYRGEYNDALACYAEQERIARMLGDRRNIAAAVGNRGLIHAHHGEYESALQCYLEQEEIARDLEDRQTVANAVGNRGFVHMDRGEYREALLCHSETESIARELGNKMLLAAATGNRGLVHMTCGEYAEALDCYIEQEVIARELGDRKLLAIAIGNRGLISAERGDYEEALDCYAEQEAVARELEDWINISIAIGKRGVVHHHRGDYEEALSCYTEQESIARKLQDRKNVALAVSNQAALYAEREDYSTAITLYRQSEEICRTIDFRRGLSDALQGLAESLLEISLAGEPFPDSVSEYIAGSDPDARRVLLLQAVRATAAECMTISRDISRSDTLFWCEVVLARIAAAGGNPSSAIEQLIALQEEAVDPEPKAALHYWLWKLGDLEVDHRANALEHYQQLARNAPRHIYQRYIKDLTQSHPPMIPGR